MSSFIRSQQASPNHYNKLADLPRLDLQQMFTSDTNMAKQARITHSNFPRKTTAQSSNVSILLAPDRTHIFSPQVVESQTSDNLCNVSYRVLKSKREARSHNQSVIVETFKKTGQQSNNRLRTSKEVMKGSFAVTNQQYQDMIVVKDHMKQNTPMSTYKVTRLRQAQNRSHLHRSSQDTLRTKDSTRLSKHQNLIANINKGYKTSMSSLNRQPDLSESNFSVMASQESRDLIFPILSKMKIINARIDTSFQSTRKDNQDSMIVIEPVDLLRSDQQSESVIANPSSLLRQVNQLHQQMREKKMQQQQKQERQRQQEFQLYKKSFNKFLSKLNVSDTERKISPRQMSVTRDGGSTRRANNLTAISTTTKLPIQQTEHLKSPTGQHPLKKNSSEISQFGELTHKSKSPAASPKSPKGKLIQKRESSLSVNSKKGQKSLFMKKSNSSAVKEVIGSMDDKQDITLEAELMDQIHNSNDYHRLSMINASSHNKKLMSRLSQSTTVDGLFKSQDTDKNPFRKVKYEVKPGIDSQLLGFTNQKKLVVNGIGKEIVQDMIKESPRKASLIQIQQNIKEGLMNKIQSKVIEQVMESNPAYHQENTYNNQSPNVSPKRQQEGVVPSETQNEEKMFAVLANKFKFYTQAKDFNNLSSVTYKENNFNLEFLKSCQEFNVVPLPAIARIQNQVLDLMGYNLNEGLSFALGKTLGMVSQMTKSKKNEIRELYFESNGMKDQMFAAILKGLLKQDSLKKISYSQNEFGQQSLEPLLEIITRTHPNNLEMLCLNSLKIQSGCIEILTKQLCYNTSLKKLRLTGMNLSDSLTVKHISQFIKTNFSLIELDLSWACMTPVQMEELSRELEHNQRLQYLNLSWNTLEERNPSSKLFVERLAYFIKRNRNLLYLNLSGMSLRGYIKSLIASLKKSQSLLAIHLSNNQFPPTFRRDIIQTFKARQITSETINLGDQSARSTIITLDDQHFEEEPEAKLINQHILNGIKAKRQQTISRFNQNKMLTSQLEEALVLNRVLGHPELVWNLESLTLQKDVQQQWVSTLKEECWVRDGWKYVIIFYRRGIDNQQMKTLIQTKCQQLEDYNRRQGKQSNHLNSPYLTGNFNGWKYQQMIPINTYAMLLDPNFQQAQKQYQETEGLVQRKISDNVLANSPRDRILSYMNNTSRLHSDVLLQYKACWRTILRKHLRNPADTLIVNYPQENDIEYDEDMADDLYVYAGYFKPGKQNFVIRDDDFYTLQIAVGVREAELRHNILYVAKERKANVRVFKKETSVFKDWREDTAASLKKMVENDISCWKVPRFVKSQEDINDCAQILSINYHTIKKIFVVYAASSCWPSISMLDFSTLCQVSQMLDKYLTISTLDRLFIATNVELVEMDDNPDKELCRFEFLEILVRIAGAKYKDPGLCTTYAEGLRRVLCDHLLPIANQIEWQEFRDKELWTLDVNDTLEANLEGLRKVYLKYYNSKKKAMTAKDLLALVRGCNLDIADKDVTLCFGLSKMSVINELTQSKQYGMMQFVEFLEFIGRLAHLRFRAPDPNSGLALSQKIELVLDAMLPLVNAQRKIPDIQEIYEVEGSDSDTDDKFQL